MNMAQSVWITGVGAVTPLGNDFSTFSENLLAGRSGVVAQDLSLSDSATQQIGASVGEIPLPPMGDPQVFRQCNRLEQLGLSCTAHALADADLARSGGPLRIGLILGLGGECFRAWELDSQAGGNRAFDPQQDTESMVHMIRRALGLEGPAVSVAAACASGGFALALGRRWVQTGWVDVCLAGSCDLITRMAYAAFHNLRAISRRGGSPAAASRPFDRGRDGFVMGEGGAVFALESVAGARRRGACPYAEILGFGTTSDASHMVIPAPDGMSTSRAIRRALEDASLAPENVDYVNAHAAGTPVGDRAEALALQLALGQSVSRVPVSSTKSMTGHLLSGAAAVEALACLVAIRHQAIPPTINLDDPDPECSLHHVAHEARCQTVRVAASNSFGFGGSNTCLVLGKAA